MKTEKANARSLWFYLCSSALLLLLGMGLLACSSHTLEADQTDECESSTQEMPEDVSYDPIEIWVTAEPYGAKGDGVTNDRAAIQKAIDDATAAPGGGIVYLDAGKTFCMSNILLRSNVELHFEDGAKILQSSDPSSFVDPLNDFVPRELVLGQYVNPDIAWDAAAFYNFPLIYAKAGTTNVKITGNGIIEMSAGEDPRGMMTMQAIGFDHVDTFVLSDFTLRKYYAYGLKAVSSQNGLFKDLTIDVTGGVIGGTDGIAIVGCSDIRITGCNINSGDDGIDLAYGYQDPRAGVWYTLDNFIPMKNIEIDHNHVTVAWDETKALGFMPWASQYPDQSVVEYSNIFIHDNYFESLGAWTGNWNPETKQFDLNGSMNPMKNIRFENNTIDRIQDNFYTLVISDVYGFNCMLEMQNGDFSSKDIYWVSREDVYSGGKDGYGYLLTTEDSDAALYQGIKLYAKRRYKIEATVKTSGVKARLFVRYQTTGELIASKEVDNIDWTTISFEMFTPYRGNYHVGVEQVDAASGQVWVDDFSCCPEERQ